MQGRGKEGQGINKASKVTREAFHPGLSQRSAKQMDALNCCPNGKKSHAFSEVWVLVVVVFKSVLPMCICQGP